MSDARTAGLAALVMLASVTAAPAAAQTGMGLIGERVVDGADRDTIAARGGEPYREIMFCVENAPIAFQEVIVRYRSGASQNVRLRQRIAAGRCSRVVGLSGRDRDIQAVEFSYAPAPGGARPTVQVYAR